MRLINKNYVERSVQTLYYIFSIVLFNILLASQKVNRIIILNRELMFYVLVPDI